MQSALAIVLLTPVLALLMLAEAALAKRAGRTVHSRGQTLNNLFIAIGQRALSATIGIAPLAGYVWLQNRVGQFVWDTSNVWHWVFAFFAVDLAMYLRHYLGHRVAMLWAVHAVHHQSTEYNLTAATRLGWIQETILFSVPLAFLGVPPSMVVVFFGLGNLYQFLQHTELVGKLGIIDRIFMTPSNHRVHHGRNPEYLDANFGNILVIWDHLFGTYVPETITPVYGTLNGLPSYDPLENNLSPLRALVSKVRQQPTASARLSTLFSGAGLAGHPHGLHRTSTRLPAKADPSPRVGLTGTDPRGIAGRYRTGVHRRTRWRAHSHHRHYPRGDGPLARWPVGVPCRSDTARSRRGSHPDAGGCQYQWAASGRRALAESP